ncbi:MAG: recombinase family protein [Bdellovibrionaceae bacterium]|nr:recombinase family protein [Pseudobdellovibrionaceae bacterium]
MAFNIGLYIRVSTEEQALRTEGSLDSQKHRLNGYVDIKNMQQTNWGVVVDEYIDDGFSAKDTNRPALQKLIRDLKKGRINTVLVTDLSRLSRSIRDFCVLIDFFKETKTQFLSLKEQFDTTTAAGEMMLFNMINLAQFERRQISERVILNFHSRAMRGLRNGGSTILGYKVDPTNRSTLIVNEEEVSLVEKVFKTYIKERSTFATAAKLRDENVPFKGANGETWNTQTVKNILNNHSYIGMREVNKGNKSKDQRELKTFEQYQVVQASWPAIIEETTFNLVQSMLSDNAKNERLRLKNAKARTFLFTGLAACGECGRPLVGSTGHGQKRDIRYYVHRPIEGKSVDCSIKRYRADEIEAALEDHLLRVINQAGYLDGVEKSVSASILSDRESVVTQKNLSSKALTQIDNDIKSLVRLQMQTDNMELQNLYSGQLIELQEQRKKERETLDRCELALADIIDPKKFVSGLQEGLKRLQMAWTKANPKMRKALLRVVVDKLIFKEGQAQVFYRQINQGSGDGKPKNKVVNLSEKRESMRLNDKNHSEASNEAKEESFYKSLELFRKPSHNPMAQGWDIGKNGCGGRI